ncbi:hypothetical protein RclHR1_07660011 [Rhizophagus clarus]|uniref:F-box domain-containing protein n=1 Tax=Rhizophagus clarus TaxID=94130 RepID=A0A2Z6S9F3_9GLOM|nr:hypothetical protein RclHR1_07660011 [Rhizophagus clarus]GES74650.1 hypothetical protein GLOIN_2v1777652 [Rhizophagus clarus]
MKLNRDVLYLISVELQDDKSTIYSCLLVNKTWCEIIIPMIWRNPWKYLKSGKEKLLLNVMLSHLTLTNKRPLFNYINFCKHLNLNKIQQIIRTTIHEEIEMKKTENDIFNLFINENTKFTHLYIPQQFDRQIHLIPGAKRCLSEIEFLSCNTNINDNVLIGLTEICKSIKELELFIEMNNNNYGIVRLIEIPKKLLNICLLTDYPQYDESFYKILENSLIKHANTTQYFKTTIQPITKILSSFVNLKMLELNGNFNAWNRLENMSLPHLEILRAKSVPIRSLISLIENTDGHLIEIKVDGISHDEISNKRIIQAIYQNCPNLMYLKILARNCSISELEKLLINCQHLTGLFLSSNTTDVFGLDYFFEILARSSPTSLFKFKFNFRYRPIKLESLKSFFINWKGRYPMLLQFSRVGNIEGYIDLIDKYREEGIIKNFDYNYGHTFEDFVWI